MCNSILYYPNIEFQQEDYKWLVRASLFWDNIYRIVPDGYVPQDDAFVRALSAGGKIGKKIYTRENIDAIERATAFFMRDCEDILENYSRFYPNWRDEVGQISMIHYSKMLGLLSSSLERANLVAQSDSQWLYIPKYISDLYMTYLAKTIAVDQGLDLSTQNSEAWLAESRISMDRRYYEVDPALGHQISFPIYIRDIFPLETNIKPDAILRFREDTEQQRHAFMRTLKVFTRRLENAQSIDEMRDIWNTEGQLIENQMSDYKRRAKVLKITKWVGAVTELVGVGFGVAAGFAAHPAIALCGAATTALGIGAARITNKLSSVPNRSYSYLCQVQDFAVSQQKNTKRRPLPPVNIW